MKLNYIKLSKDLFKVSLGNSEFYIRFTQHNAFSDGTGVILEPKDPEHANALTENFHEAMTDTCKACEAIRDNKSGSYCTDHDIIKIKEEQKEDSKIL